MDSTQTTTYQDREAERKRLVNARNRARNTLRTRRLHGLNTDAAQAVADAADAALTAWENGQ